MVRAEKVAHLALLVAFVAIGAPGSAQQLIRVPEDEPELQRALDMVVDGGAIEIAGGVYPVPAGGLVIRNAGKSFTVRAAAAAEVVLDGGGTEPVLRFIETVPEGRLPVTFERLAFRNGRSTTETVAGGVTVLRSEARFVGCRFESNHSSAPTGGGGGVLVFDRGLASFVDCAFTDNSADNRGGGLSVELAAAYAVRTVFEGNRTNAAGHSAAAVGGAISVINGQLRLVDSHLEANEAGWVGGAIYAIGVWSDPVAVPVTEVLLTGTTLRDNRTAAHPCCPAAGTPFGGAIHVENQVALRLDSSQLLENRSVRGGAISSYRAVVEIADSVFRGNLAETDGDLNGVGGAIYVSSRDFADVSTDFGAANRPTGRLEIDRSFFQGRFGSTGVSAVNGGCLLLAGDLSRMYGETGVAQDGDEGTNRLPVSIRDTAFVDCDVASSDGAARGGAINGELVDLELRGSLVLSCDADGGGGLTIRQQSRLKVDGSTFADNSAGSNGGGALQILGSELQVSASSFIGNRVEGSPANQSRGAAIYSRPIEANPQLPGRPDLDVTGLVSGSVLSGNTGVPLFEIDSDSPPVNRLVYNDNRIHAASFGGLAYVNILVARNGLNVAGLNGLVVQRTGTTATDKSTVPNIAAGTPITAGALLATPGRVLSPLIVGRASSGAGSAFLPFAWSGSGGATLDGAPLAESAGFREVTTAGDHTLDVGTTTVGSAAVLPASCGGGPLFCLADDRFLFDVLWQDFRGNGDAATGVELTDDTGYVYFNNPQNVEIVLKVIDGRRFTDHFWVFYGALSNVAYSITGIDSETGVVKSWVNPARTFASVGDNFAFPDALVAGTGGGDGGVSSLRAGLLASGTRIRGPALRGSCNPGPTTLCLRDGRFRAEMDWRSFQGVPGVGRAEMITGDTGYFYFNNPDNVELVVKVIDGRRLTDHYWVFYGALSNVEFELTMTDTETGEVAHYENPARTFASVGDTQALPGEP